MDTPEVQQKHTLIDELKIGLKAIEEILIEAWHKIESLFEGKKAEVAAAPAAVEPVRTTRHSAPLDLPGSPSRAAFTTMRVKGPRTIRRAIPG
jgi:hypothetical protein